MNKPVSQDQFDVEIALDQAAEAKGRTQKRKKLFIGFAAGLDPEWSLDLTGRAGYLLNPTTLAYARGGYTSARTETGVDTPLIRLTESENRDGWTLGAGIERKLQEKISARLEYRFSDLSEGDGNFDRHRMLVGIAYRF